MEVEQNFVDSHGASFVGFGITRLLDFDLIARFKQISTMKLYVPGRAGQYAYPELAPALTRPVRWDVIENNYDLMMKYATAIRLRTASTEAILRRFTSETTHPAYAAMPELGRAQRTIFLARWLHHRDLQRETTAALNVVENYNGVNDYIRFGKSGQLSSNRREEQELSMLCLHILQSCLGFINTLMIQDILAGPQWADVLGDADRRGLTPLFTSNMTPTGTSSSTPPAAWPSAAPTDHRPRARLRLVTASLPTPPDGFAFNAPRIVRSPPSRPSRPIRPIRPRRHGRSSAGSTSSSTRQLGGDRCIRGPGMVTTGAEETG